MFKPLSLLTSGLLFILIVSLLIPVNTGCKTKTVYDTTYIYDTIRISQNKIFVCYLNQWDQYANLFSDPIADPNQSDVKIEWGSNTYLLPEKSIGFSSLVFDGDTLLDTLTNCNVTLTSNIGNGQGTIIVPGSTTITNPNYYDTLPLGQNINCNWTTAQGANFYWFYFYIEGYNNGIWIGYTWLDTFITNTSFVLQSNLFNMPTATRYTVSFYINAYAGPFPQPNASGNMTGTVKGCLLGEGYGNYVYFYVGSPPMKTDQRHERKQPSRQDHMNAYLKQLGIEQVIK
jgi:hypothetical protein